MSQAARVASEGEALPLSPLATWVKVIHLVMAVVGAVIALRFLMKLLAVDPHAGLARLVYGVTEPIVSPFTGLLGNPVGTGSQIEVPSLVAMVAYGLIGALLAREVLLMAGGRMAPWRR